MIIFECDYKNALAVALEIFAGGASVALVICAFGFAIWLCAKAGIKL